MFRFLVVDDYTLNPIWDDLIQRAMLGLKSKPQGWESRENILPEGDWTLAYGTYQHASDEAFQNFGVRKPTLEELPVVFVVNPDGSVEEQTRVNVDQTVGFIAARI